MARQRIAPTVTKDRIGGTEEHEKLSHPAFGVVRINCPQSNRNENLFGSNVGHMSFLHFEVLPAELHRTLSRDWIHQSKGPILSFYMTHDQFSRLISGIGRAEGVPVTLDRVCTGPAEDVAEIASMPSKQVLFRKEIRDSIRRHLEGMGEQLKRLDAMVESGKLSKKKLREIAKELERHLAQAPGNMDFVIKSAEETIETATETAKVEVDAYVNATAQALGLRRLEELSSSLERPALPSAPDAEE